MSDPVPVKVLCYTWHQFSVQGEEVDSYNTWRANEWQMKREIYDWLVDNMNGRWARINGFTCPLFIEDKNDAMMFKLTWHGL